MDIVVVAAVELTPLSLAALASNGFRYYATGIDGGVVFRKSMEVRDTPPTRTQSQPAEQKEQVNGSSN